MDKKTLTEYIMIYAITAAIVILTAIVVTH